MASKQKQNQKNEFLDYRGRFKLSKMTAGLLVKLQYNKYIAGHDDSNFYVNALAVDVHRNEYNDYVITFMITDPIIGKTYRKIKPFTPGTRAVFGIKPA